MKFSNVSICVFLSAFLSMPVMAATKQSLNQKIDPSAPTEFAADKVDYDTKNSKVIASGHVEINHEGQILIADKVTYDQKTGIIKAIGNVSLMEKTGNVFFAEEMEIKDDFKEGVIEKLKAQFIDKSNMTSSKAHRKDGNITVLEDVIYSPCPVCKEDPNKPLLWRVRASKAIINEKEQKVSYQNARLEVKDIPVLYTPYISHPTPGADRKSGFLIPKYSNDRVFGTMVKTPFYVNMAPNMDIVLSPTFTTEEGVIMEADFRHLVKSGEYNISGSITNPNEIDENGRELEGRKVRGHLEGKGQFNLNEEWTWGFNGKRATDDTYLQKYHFGNEDVLTSKAYLTKIEDRNFINAETITFQGLKEDDDPGKTPLIFPRANAHFENPVNIDFLPDSRINFDANTLVLRRDEGVSSSRISLKSTYEIPLITKSGQLLNLSASLRGDGYNVEDVQNGNNQENGLVGRVIPEVVAKWSYPFMRDDVSRQFVLEPVASVIVSPYGGNPDKLPNEDSQDIEFSDENLFDANHFTGFDVIENGPRMNYGLRGAVSDVTLGNINAVVGQNYRTRIDKNFTEQSGLDDYFSDYVGKLSYDYNNIFDIAYKFRVDKDSMDTRRNSVTTTLNTYKARFSVDYVNLDENFDVNNSNNDANREIIITSGMFKLNDNWEISGHSNRDLENGEWVAIKTDLNYIGDCVDFSLTWLKEFTYDRDIVPNTTVSFRVSLKNLGY